nr:MAG TPA: hypothetical protein [Caudoviricetes sp.]DAN84387.1 MAG TPA: hypothetical protein [Caudoviricetes sp.]DAQ56795.1 MAG TPA: hypothetical protein [Caudoviricetes sp.]
MSQFIKLDLTVYYINEIYLYHRRNKWKQYTYK